jgi:hypothetical protein
VRFEENPYRDIGFPEREATTTKERLHHRGRERQEADVGNQLGEKSRR